MLLLVLLLLLLLNGMLHEHPMATIAAWTAVLMASVYAATPRRQVRLHTALLALPPIAIAWYSLLNPTAPVMIAMAITFAIPLLVAATLILRAVLRQREIHADTIFGALCVYLQIGWLFALCYAVIDGVHTEDMFGLERSGGDKHTADVAGNVFPRYVYFSFTTLTTLGYGDLSPKIRFARNVAVIEAVVGQIYIATLIAGLVSRSVSGSAANQSAAEWAADEDPDATHDD